jgi:hypothetical protein
MSAFQRIAALTVLILLAIGLACGLTLETGGSNFPDSGVSCGPDAGAGSGTLTGPSAFAVASAYEQRQYFVQVDSGVVDNSWITLGLYNQAANCVLPAPDGGASTALPVPALFAILTDPTGAFAPGTYLVARDAGGGPSALFLLSTPSGSESSTSGSFQLTSITPCALSGSFDITLSSGLDGGTATSLSGSMTAAYSSTCAGP